MSNARPFATPGCPLGVILVELHFCLLPIVNLIRGALMMGFAVLELMAKGWFLQGVERWWMEWL